MSNDELLDLVNEKDEVTGTVWKSKAHKDPSKIHREVVIAVFNKNGDVLLQRRSLNKTNDPGEWKISAAGHVSADEDPKTATEREVFEELGIKVVVRYYTKLFSKRVGKTGGEESRFFYIYYAVCDKDVILKLDADEVMDAKWIKPEKLVYFAKDNTWDVSGLSHRTIMEIYNKFIYNRNNQI